MLSFSAALLAGGKSRRMGRDKALLHLPGSDEPLWQHQLRTLRALQPEKIFWSGPPRENLPDDTQVIPDGVPNAGPLAGISACLDASPSDLLVVLAVDLPQMDAACLRALIGQCTPSVGAVPQQNDLFEPLAAIYPKTLRDLAADHLRQGRYTLQEFVKEAVRRNLVTAVPVNAVDAPKFKNVNAPDDLAGLK